MSAVPAEHSSPRRRDLPALSKACRVVQRGDRDYVESSYQYAMSTLAEFVAPAVIFYPSGPDADGDVKSIIRWAGEKGLAIAVRTGGHQYSGASSTNGENVQIDLSGTYRDADWSQLPVVRMGVSHRLYEVAAEGEKRGHFLPHGLCAHVNVGGHVQTGGYGMCIRSFGLFSDHIISLELFTADGVKRTLRKGQLADQSEEDLWFSLLGGSPGNLGIVTHVTFRMLSDADYPKSRGLKLVAKYTRERTEAVCRLMSDFMTANPVGLDFQITVGSTTLLGKEGVDNLIASRRSDPTIDIGSEEFPLHDQFRVPVLLVYMQYGNPGGATEDDSHVDEWFEKLRAIFGTLWVAYNIFPLGHIAGLMRTGVSVMDSHWLFKIVREYNYPYVKLAQNSFDERLSDQFITDLCDYIDDIQASLKNGLMQIMQLSVCGGSNSKAFQNRGNGTAFAWRDCMVNLVYDVFYSTEIDPLAQQLTITKQAVATQKFIGPQGSFCKRDCRYLWASHGDRNMSVVWPCYMESATYDRVLRAKRFWDPKHVFSPNALCVGYAGPLESAPTGTNAAAIEVARLDAGLFSAKRVAPRDGLPPGLSSDCIVVRRGDENYDLQSYQYASTSGSAFINPAIIFQPRGSNAERDIAAIINWVRDRGIALAVRSGGHQYLGASSTSGDNVQLDLQETFTTMEVLDSDKALVRLGVSNSLIAMSKWLGARGWFLPHGVCAHVRVGGHMQTGGYGMCTRAFGGFADRVVAIECITADGHHHHLQNDSLTDDERQLWFGILGGGPGNFAVVTHATFRALKDSDYPKSRGLKTMAPYSKALFKELLELQSDFEAADTVGIDFQVTVTSGTNQMVSAWMGCEGLDSFIMAHHRELPSSIGPDNLKMVTPIALVVLWLQYANPGGAEEDDSHVDQWFQRARAVFSGPWRALCRTAGCVDGPCPLSQLVPQWLGKFAREFNYPFVKSAQGSFNDRLSSTCIDDICHIVDDVMANRQTTGLMTLTQMFAVGGKNSAVWKNRGNGTAFSWRGQRFGLVLDIFYNNRTNPFARQEALQKQALRHERLIGARGSFSDRDYRMLGLPWGDRNLANVWRCYFEPAIWERALKAKALWDPKGVFNANAFSVPPPAHCQVQRS